MLVQKVLESRVIVPLWLVIPAVPRHQTGVHPASDVRNQLRGIAAEDVQRYAPFCELLGEPEKTVVQPP